MLELMSLAKVKAILGLVSTDLDNELSLFLTVVSADVRRILNDPMDRWIAGKIEAGSDLLKTSKRLALGSVVFSPELPSDTYVKEITKDGYRLSEKASLDASQFVPTINVSQWQAIARMVFYRTSVPAKAGDKVVRKSMGPVSVSFSADVNKRWNYPQDLIADLGYPRLRVPC